jgi:phytoene desaturase
MRASCQTTSAVKVLTRTVTVYILDVTIVLLYVIQVYHRAATVSRGLERVDCDVLVVGAGAGGLAAGATLASRGFDTVVLEQADTPGGCASSFEADGYCFDVGACIIEVARAHDWFYEGLGLRREDYVTFLRNDPQYEVFDLLTGERFLMPDSIEGMAELIARSSPADARTFIDFMTKHGKRVDEFADVMLRTPQGRLTDLARVFARYPKVIPSMRYFMAPYGKVVEDLFEHPYTRRLMSNYSVIGGLPPSLQSGMMLWLCYAEKHELSYPKGGMGAVPLGMARALADVGGSLRLGARVERILVENGRARGAVLADGAVITSRAVVSNVNATNLYLRMIGRGVLPRAVVRGLESYKPSPSVVVGYLGLDHIPPMRAQHIFAMTSPELIDGFWTSMYDKGVALPQSVGLVSSPSFADPSLAPAGKANLAFISMAPPMTNGRRWADIKWDYLEKGIETVDTIYLPGIKDHIVFKTVATPQDFEDRLSLPGGAIYGYSMSMLSQMAFRPAQRSRCVKDLYLCGASTHTCSVPGAICSGMNAADLAGRDLGRRRG